MFAPMMAFNGRSEEKFRNSTFSAVNATLGTGIATLATATAYDVTKPDLTLYNSSATQWVMLDRMYLRALAVNTASTSFHAQFVVRQGNSLTSGGTTLPVVNIGGNAANLITAQRPTVITATFGVLTAAAAAATFDRIVWREQIRDVIFTVDDTFHLVFGEGVTTGFAQIVAGTLAAKSVHALPPMWIGPGSTMQVHFISPSQSDDPLFEISANWIEAPAP